MEYIKFQKQTSKEAFHKWFYACKASLWGLLLQLQNLYDGLDEHVSKYCHCPYSRTVASRPKTVPRAPVVNKYVASGLSRHKRFTACIFSYRYFEYNINSKDVLHVFLCLSKAIR